MNLIRVGQLTINLDRVACIRDLAIPGAPAPSGPVRIEFDQNYYVEVNASADVLRAWLATNTTPVAS
jgi:hypothetical protein